HAESYVGPKTSLLKALKAGNRAEAWYEIRFGSNEAELDGYAKRRYYEAQVFGLYNNPANVELPEAEQAYRMLTKHRSDILQYEKDFGTDPNASTSEQPAENIASANSDYHLTGTADQVQTLVQA